MSELQARLREGRPVLLDGGLGTQLMARGMAVGACTELMVLEHPDWLEDIARAYAAAGADVVTANSFGASPLKLKRYDLDARAAELNRIAVELARRGGGDEVWIAGDVGPSGELLQPFGDAAPGAVRASYVAQCRALAEAGVDLFIVETMIDLNEAVLALEAAREVAPDLPVLATMTFDATPRGFFTVMGNPVDKVCAALAAAGADAVGANCGHGGRTLVEVARAFVQHSTLPVVIQPNAGLPELVDGQACYRETPGFLVERARELLDLGVRIVGGCCGTTPEHIAALRALIDERG
ncbi:MAG: homocysteine S-methyltransferase family protein [Pseudomonadota bacterium]